MDGKSNFRKYIVVKPFAYKKKKTAASLLFAPLFLLFVLLSGCRVKTLDPTQIGRFRPVPAENVILETLGLAEEETAEWEQGEEPRPIDTVAVKADWAFMSGDIIQVSIDQLLRQGETFSQEYVVSETGRISIPDVGVIEIAGLTAIELEELLKESLSPDILVNPLVSVALLSSQNRTFSIHGNGIARPNRYAIDKYDLTLLEALVMAGGTAEINAEYIYVTRRIEQQTQIQQVNRTTTDNLDLRVIGDSTASQSTNSQNISKPQRQISSQWPPKSNVVISSSEMITDSRSADIPQGFGLYSSNVRNFADGGSVLVTPSPSSQSNSDESVSVQDVLQKMAARSGSGSGAANNDSIGTSDRLINSAGVNYNSQISLQGTSGSSDLNTTMGLTQSTNGNPQEQETGHIEWRFQNGRWTAVQVGTPQQSTIPEVEAIPEREFIIPQTPDTVSDIQLTQQSATTRRIKIPVRKLLEDGDARYNIIIKPGDVIRVPFDVMGEYSISGNVNNPGPKPLTGRSVTLMTAISDAGGLGPLAQPKRCEVRRRIGNNREVIVMVDLDKIASGEQPDFYIKPNDLINVGTDVTARWRAILRNAFRATYGFGFVYDRNFADRDFYTSRPFDIF